MPKLIPKASRRKPKDNHLVTKKISLVFIKTGEKRCRLLEVFARVFFTKSYKDDRSQEVKNIPEYFDNYYSQSVNSIKSTDLKRF